MKMMIVEPKEVDELQLNNISAVKRQLCNEVVVEPKLGDIAAVEPQSSGCLLEQRPLDITGYS